MALAWVFGINENVIQIEDNKNVKVFGQDLIDKSGKLADALDNLNGTILYLKQSYQV